MKLIFSPFSFLLNYLKGIHVRSSNISHFSTIILFGLFDQHSFTLEYLHKFQFLQSNRFLVFYQFANYNFFSIFPLGSKSFLPFSVSSLSISPWCFASINIFALLVLSIAFELLLDYLLVGQLLQLFALLLLEVVFGLNIFVSSFFVLSSIFLLSILNNFEFNPASEFNNKVLTVSVSQHVLSFSIYGHLIKFNSDSLGTQSNLLSLSFFWTLS